MGANFIVALLSIAVTQQPPPDTAAPYTSPAVQELVERARARRLSGDSLVADYRARIKYRLTVGTGRRRWAQVPVSAVEEQVADVQWQRPNDLRVDVVGRRSGSRSETIELSSVWDRPWFVPRGVDDSVRIFSNEFPARGALHPLAATGPEWYRYTLTSGLTVTTARGGSLRLLEVDVTPRRSGPALIAGKMWIDSATAEVVRLTFRYLGTSLWVTPEKPTRSDSASARRLNAFANQLVNIDADLEYSLQDGRYWMPYRQVIAGRVRLPMVSDLVIPFQATTTFDDFTINTGRPMAFTLDLPDRPSTAEERKARRDSLQAERRGRGRGSDQEEDAGAWTSADRWPGGRYELHRPSDDSLSRFDGWQDSLSLQGDPANVERIRETESALAYLAEGLPDSVTGERSHGFAYERLTDAFRYDRVQGLSLGLGYRVRLPAVQFTDLYGSVRYGFSDERVTGRLTVLRDAPGGRLALSGYRDVTGVDPFSPGHGVGNTLNALFVAHDDADYALLEGGSLRYETSLATGLDLGVGGRVERQTSAASQATSGLNDFLGGSGDFPPNPPVDEGTFGGAYVRLAGVRDTRWSLTADVLGGEGQTTGRLFGDLRRDLGGQRGLTVRIKAGIATAPTLQQSLFRLGGVNTVRGFDYGTGRGQSFWAAQLDIAPLPGRLRPVLFLDAGQAERPSELFSSKALAGGGIGLSMFSGLVRFDLSYPISTGSDGKVRFDIVVQAPR
ncbi:MAG: hypothetical protein ACAI18_10520 [Gemmatimonadales bacterium]